LKVESSTSIAEHLLWTRCKRILNSLLFPIYLFGAHWYDAFCVYISNEFVYLAALAFMGTFLFSLSVLLVGGHAWVEKKFGWDLMELEEFKGSAATKPIPGWRIFKRFKRWMTKTRKTTFWLGSIFIGPPIVAVLLRKNSSWGQNLKYIIPGTFLSVIVWVSLYAGVGMFTWNQYVIPFFNYLTS